MILGQNQNKNDSVESFFQDVSHLLTEKYPELRDKFGIWRAHQHFPIGSDEVFHETSDPLTKESTLRIIKKEALPEGAFVSAWTFDSAGKEVPATWCCDDKPSY